MNIGSLLYLHRDSLASEEIKNDIDFLVGELERQAVRRRRWELYLAEHERIREDETDYMHAGIMEHLAYKESIIEGLEEQQILLLMWAARFHVFREAEYVTNLIAANLKSEYARDMLEKSVSLALHGEDFSDDSFDYPDFFDSLKRRARLKLALTVAEGKPIAQWNALVASVLYANIPALLGHGEKYRSVRVFLRKNERPITHSLENHFHHQHISLASSQEVADIKKRWRLFITQ